MTFSKKMLMFLVLITILVTFTACGTKASEESPINADTSGAETQTPSEASGEETSAADSSESPINSEWTTGVINDGIELYEVFSFGGGLIGVDSMAVYYSADGLNWEMTKNFDPYPVYDAFFAGGQFAVFDADNTHFTTDGKSWTSAPRQDNFLFNTAMYDGENFLSVDTAQLCLSTDALKFTTYYRDPMDARTSIDFRTASNEEAPIRRLAIYGGTYYAAGAGIWKATDINNWTQVVTIEEMVYGAEDLLYNGSTFFVPAGYEQYAFNGTKITKVSPVGSVFIVDSKNRFLGAYGTGVVNVSTDGLTWEPLFAEDGVSFRAYTAVEFNGKLFVYGEDGNVRYAEMK